MEEKLIYKNFNIPEFNKVDVKADEPLKHQINTATKPIEDDSFENSNSNKSKTLLEKLFKKSKQPQVAKDLTLDTLTTLGAFTVGALAKKGITFVDMFASNMSNSKSTKALKALNFAIPFAASFLIRPVLNGINNLTLTKEDKKENKNNWKSNLSNGIGAALITNFAPLAPLAFVSNAFVSYASNNENKEPSMSDFIKQHADNFIIDIAAFSVLTLGALKNGREIDKIQKIIQKAKVNAASCVKYTMPEDSLTQFQSLARDLGFDLSILIDKENGKVNLSEAVKLDEELMDILLEKGQDGNIEGKMRKLEEMNIFLPKYFQTIMDIPDELQEKLCKQIDEIIAGREAQKNQNRWLKDGNYVTNYALDEAFERFEKKNWSLEGLKDYQAIIRKIKSNCPASRSVDDAQGIIDGIYGSGKYTIVRGGKKDGLLGVGSIAESYLAKDSDGNEVVVKLLKKQFEDGKKVEKDKKALMKKIEDKSDIKEGFYITFGPQEHTIFSTEHQTYDKNLVENMCQVWEKETDLSQEAISAGQIKAQATKYQAIEPIDAKRSIFIMQKAQGVQLDSDDIAAKWQEAGLDEQDFSNFVDNYIAAYCEQLFALPDEAQKVVQSDPHGGNILVDLAKIKGLKDKKSTPITIIDYGNTIKTTRKVAAKNLFNHIDYLFGNTDLIARNLLSGADLNGKNLEDEVRSLSLELKNNIFNCDTKIDTKNPIEIFRAANDFCIEYMRRNNIIPNATNINQMKAEETYILSNLGCLRRIADGCGYDISKAIDKKRIIKQLIKEMSRSTMKSFKQAPLYTMKELSSRIKFITKNPEHAFSCLNLNFELFS